MRVNCNIAAIAAFAFIALAAADARTACADGGNDIGIADFNFFRIGAATGTDARTGV